MKLRLQAKHGVKLGLSLLAVGLFLCITPQAAKAAPNIGPDPVDIGEQSYYGNSYPGVTRQWKFAVSRDGYTDIYSTRIKIYLPNPTGTITLEDVDLCYNDTQKPGIPNYDQSYQQSTGLMTSFVMRNTGTGTITRNGYWDGSSGCYNDQRTYDVSGSSLDPETGMYPYFLDVTAIANGKYVNLFKVIAPSGAIVSYDSTNDSASFGLQQAYPIPPGSNPQVSNPPNPYKDYSTWRLRFGPDCTVNSPTVTDYVEIYDDDNNGANNDVQPRQFQTRMLEYDRSGNYVRDVYPKSVMWNSVNHASPTTNSAGGWDDNLVVSGDQFHIIWTNQSKHRIRAYYDFKSDMVYQWKLYNVYYDNTLQLSLPFDSVFYYRECQLPKADLKAGMSVNPAKMSPGETAAFTPSITTSNFNQSFTANCAIVRTVYSPDGSSSSLGNQPCVTTGGSSDIPINGNGTVTLRANNYTAPTSLAPGSRVCDKVTITNPSSAEYYADPADQTAESCVKIIGRPYLTVLNNDVWAGSRFDYNGDSCSGQAPRLSSISSWVANGAGAMGEYGTLALGPVIGFGSANAPASNALTFANTPSNGSLGASTRCVPDYASTIGTDGEPWPGFAGIPANAGIKKYYYPGSHALGAGGTVPAGTQVVFVVDGDATLNNNITYANSYNDQNDITSFWLIAKGNIYIKDNVTSLSGFYVAQGTSGNPGKIHTCVQGSGAPYNPLTTNVCNNGLDVYGAFLADQIYWQRTRGTAVPGQTYAESIQFDPGLYLSVPYDAATSQDMQTQDTKELPPIY